MYDIGRVCKKLAGRDADKLCVVVDIIDENNVLVDGETRRKKCNVKHLYPLDQQVKLQKKASHDAVKKALAAIGIEITDTKPKKAAERPKKVRKEKTKPKPEPKAKPEKKPETEQKA